MCPMHGIGSEEVAPYCHLQGAVEASRKRGHWMHQLRYRIAAPERQCMLGEPEIHYGESRSKI